MVLGVRKAESTTRMQLMNAYQVNGHILRRHKSLSGAYIYAPVSDFSTEDIWGFLLDNKSPWGGNNEALYKLYRNANAGECPLVFDDSTPTCGSSRFGCWVCTVANRDTSMESLVSSGEEWMKPLLEIRNYLSDTGIPENKLKYRDTRGRDGRVIIKSDGQFAARTFKFDVSRNILTQLLNAEKTIRLNLHDPTIELISRDELLEIRRIWISERQDWEDSLPMIFSEVYGESLQLRKEDDIEFNKENKITLKRICVENEMSFLLIAKLLEVEKQNSKMNQRANARKEILRILGFEWREEDKILEDHEYFEQKRLV